MTQPAPEVDAQHPSFDAVVIGAGPAGTLAARTMALRGMRVALVDRGRFPRDKVCGCCLNQAAVEILQGCGLGRVIPSQAPVLRTLRILRRGRTVDVRTRAGVAISRWRLDHALLSAAAEAGAHLRTQTSAALGERRSDGWTIRLRTRGAESWIVAATIVCADGLAGGFLPQRAPWEAWVSREGRMGLGARLNAEAIEVPPGRIDMHVGDDGYVGLVRLEDGTIDVAAAVRPEFVKAHASPAEALMRLVQSDRERIGAALTGAAIRGTTLLTRRRATLEHDGIFVAGDAASYVEPFTGEGMSWAMASGILAGEACAAHLAGKYRAGAYSDAMKQGLGMRRALCGLAARLLRSPLMIDAAVAIGTRLPHGASLVSERVGSPIRLALEFPA